MKKLPAGKLLAFLAAGALAVGVATTTARSQGDLLGCQSYLSRLGDGLALYSKEHNGQLPSNLAELVPTYVPHLPTCPRASQPYVYTQTEGGGFKVSCPGEHPGLKPGNPYVDSARVAKGKAPDPGL